MTDEVRLEGGPMTHVVWIGDKVRSRRDPLATLVVSAYPRKRLDSRFNANGQALRQEAFLIVLG
jgi:hypothetical protein